VDRPATPVYDCRDLPPDEGELSLELPGPRSRYEQLAAQIRRDIYAGEYPPGSTLPPELALAAKHKVSRALANRAVQVLSDEELVSQEQGRGTYVRSRRIYQVTVSVPVPESKRPGSSASLRKAVRTAVKAEPAVTSVESAEVSRDAAAVSLLIDAADGDWAVHAAKQVVRSAGGAWSWDGWDLTLASYLCKPFADAPAEEGAGERELGGRSPHPGHHPAGSCVPAVQGARPRSQCRPGPGIARLPDPGQGRLSAGALTVCHVDNLMPDVPCPKRRYEVKVTVARAADGCASGEERTIAELAAAAVSAEGLLAAWAADLSVLTMLVEVDDDASALAAGVAVVRALGGTRGASVSAERAMAGRPIT
jgi:DNA-binding transcriptional regulator YhcF (GntR family)